MQQLHLTHKFVVQCKLCYNETMIAAVASATRNYNPFISESIVFFWSRKRIPIIFSQKTTLFLKCDFYHLQNVIKTIESHPFFAIPHIFLQPGHHQDDYKYLTHWVQTM